METETPVVDAPVCAYGYFCSEELYNRGCLKDWENMYVCQVCINGNIEWEKERPVRDRLNLLKRIENIKNRNYGFTIGVEKYSNIFGRTELIPLKDFKVNMEVPIIPLNCLCGCSHKIDFTLDEQNKRFEKTGKYKCFFNAKHITMFKKEHIF
jgi:hypothetical protein